MKKLAGSAAWSDADDAPELTETMLDEAEVFEGDRFVRRGRGRPKSGAAKVLISVRLDADLVAQLRAAGPGWQSRINGLLREGLVRQGGAGTTRQEISMRGTIALVENRPGGEGRKTVPRRKRVA
jgi:uncharacterized protein (DUF4415 family)